MIVAVDTDKLVQNSLFTLMARGLMIIAGGVGLPIAGVMMTRILTAADNLADKVEKQTVQFELLKQKVEHSAADAAKEMSTIRLQITDHEGRLRLIERRVPMLIAPN